MSSPNSNLSSNPDVVPSVVSSATTQTLPLNQSLSVDTINDKILKFFNGDTLAASVFSNKYALKQNGKPIETPEGMFDRLSDEFARIEQKYANPLSRETIRDALYGFKRIIPQGSPMYGIGNNNSTSSLGNCFVIGNSTDSIGSIGLIDNEQQYLMKERAGVGHDLSHLRPRGDVVRNAAESSTGAASFMDRYSNTTREIAQGGRRGALMLTIRVDHPDIEEFIQIKQDLTKVTGANISVKITDEFMRAVESDSDFDLKFNDKVYKSIKARKLWAQIVHNAWNTAEPGVLFWDKILRESPADCYPGFLTISTNPCGELPLCAYDSCRLLLLNLFGYVDNPFKENAVFNFERFEKDIVIAMRLMDDLVDLEEEKLDKIIKKMETSDEDPDTLHTGLRLWKKIKEKLLAGRRTGLGITAEGDTMAALNLRYGSDESIIFGENIHKFLAINAYKTSITLAKERGAFPLFDFNREKSEFIKRLFKEDPSIEESMKEHGRRNIAILTIAPTGSVSILAQTTSGIEPAFMIAYKRNRKVNPGEQVKKSVTVDALGDQWVQYNVLHHKFHEWAKANFPNEDLDDDKILDSLIKKSPYFGSTANEIDYIKKTELQGKIQKWIDHSISVTINMPSNVTKDQVNDVYLSAWKWGCKGCTVYRDGCRSGVLVSKDDTKPKAEPPKKRPKSLNAEIVRFLNNKEQWIAFIGLFDGRPYEIFTGKNAEINIPESVETGFIVKDKESSNFDFHYNCNGKSIIFKQLNKCFDSHFWNYAILISHMLRLNPQLNKMVEIIWELKFPDDAGINTWKSGVARALSKYIPAGTKGKDKCMCGETYSYQEGCLVCKNCGNSKCG